MAPLSMPRFVILLIRYAAKVDSLGVGVDIHPSRTEEADEGLSGLGGEMGGQAGGGGDRRDDGNATGEGFLHDFEGGAAADQQDTVVQWDQTVKEGEAEDFVEGVVAAYILAEGH